MAHLEVNTFLKNFISELEPFFPAPSVLEIGSYDVNGSVRACFKKVSKYVGVDLISGPSVDVVSKGHLYRGESKFDLVISVESFEHNSEWVKTLENMLDQASQDGILIITCATRGRLEHGTYRTDPYSSPGTASSENGYYRNLTAEDFERYFRLDKLFVSYGFYINNITKDLYFYGLKGEGVMSSSRTDRIFKKSALLACGVRKAVNYKSYILIRSFYILLYPFYNVMTDESYQDLMYGIYKNCRKYC